MQDVIVDTAVESTVAGAELAVEGTVAATKGIGALAMAGVELVKANPFVALGAAAVVTAAGYFGFKGVKAWKAKRAEKAVSAVQAAAEAAQATPAAAS